MKYKKHNKKKSGYKQHKYNKSNNYNKRKQQQQVAVVKKHNIEPQKNFFGGNLVSNMNFGGKDHELSGYVSRELVLIDKHGNKQINKEKQFFNRRKHPMSISINNNKNKGNNNKS